MTNSLPYLGPSAPATANDSELATLSYVNALVSKNLTQAQVNSQINTALSPYATKAQVDQKSQTIGTMNSVYQGAANAVQLSQIGVNTGTYPTTLQSWLQQQVIYTSIASSPAGAYPPALVSWAQSQVTAGPSSPVPLPALPGIVGLTKDNTGKAVLPTALMNAAFINNQQYPPSITVPTTAQQNATTITAGSTALTTVYGPVPVPTVPTVPFYLIVCGTLDAHAATDGVFPFIEVTLGAPGATGSVVLATGCGVAESYIGGVMSQYPQNSQLSGQYIVPDWAMSVDVVAVGGGAAGEWGFLGPGVGGLGGKWGAVTLSGSALTPGMALNFTIGAGGIPVTLAQAEAFQYFGGPGGATTITNNAGSTVLQVAGGTCVSDFPGTLTAVSQNGQPPLNGNQINNATRPVPPFTFDGNSYYGAINPHTGLSDIQDSPAGSNVSGGNGYAPGGGGEGGGNAAPGGIGAPGGVWFFARPANSSSSGGVNIVPVSPAITGVITPASNLQLYVSAQAGTLSSIPVSGSKSITVPGANTGTLSNLYVWAVPAGPSNV